MVANTGEKIPLAKFVYNKDNNKYHMIWDTGKMVKPKNKKGNIFIVEHAGKKHRIKTPVEKIMEKNGKD